jgi:hypothetical protein
MSEKNPVQSAVARLAVASRPDRNPDPVKVASARNDLVAARLERAIMEALNPSDPTYEPLRPADRTRLARLLKAG